MPSAAVPQKENIWCQGSGVVNTGRIQMNTKVNTTRLRHIKALNICAHCEMATRIILTTMHEDKGLDMLGYSYQIQVKVETSFPNSLLLHIYLILARKDLLSLVYSAKVGLAT